MFQFVCDFACPHTLFLFLDFDCDLNHGFSCYDDLKHTSNTWTFSCPASLQPYLFIVLNKLLLPLNLLFIATYLENAPEMSATIL